MSNCSSDHIIVGQVGKVYGVQGWVKIHSFTTPLENILNYQPWLIYIGQAWQKITTTKARHQGNEIVVQFNHCNDRDLARQYVNCQLAIHRDQLPEIGKNEYYWADLKGLTVITTTGIHLGVIDHLLETGANDVLVVKGDKERLIPYLPKQVVTEINLQTGTIYVDWDPEF